MKKTDKLKFPWPSWTENFVANRRFCRSIYKTVMENVITDRSMYVCFSGGLDSTVLSHVLYNSFLINTGSVPNLHLIYVNHHFRSEQDIQTDIEHTKSTACFLNCKYSVLDVYPEHNQNSARQYRYDALSEFIKDGVGYLGHHANDIVETRLFQILTGRQVVGIGKEYIHNDVSFIRPMLFLTREDIEKYAKLWNLKWSEDISNSTNEYARNRIRHDLIPWIKENINPGIIKTLSGDCMEKKRDH
jgi:tRNA(Ile)-lysidine synthase